MKAAFRDKFKKIERDFTPLYRAKHGKYKSGHYDVKHYWSASIEGVPTYDASSPTGARLRWRCSITAEWTCFVQWTCDTLDEAFDSLDAEVTNRPHRKIWIPA